jgi:hypothetical protein
MKRVLKESRLRPEELHVSVSVDQEGNLYTAEVFSGRAQSSARARHGVASRRAALAVPAAEAAGGERFEEQFPAKPARADLLEFAAAG